MLFQPLLTPLGFGSQLNANGWVFVLAAVSGLIAKENVIATFGVLASCIAGGLIPEAEIEGAGEVAAMINATGISTAALIAFIAFNMLTIPCFAAVATAKSELGSKKAYVGTLVFWIVASYVVSSAVYTIGSWWWTSFIWAAVLAALICIIIWRNKKAAKKGA